MEYKNLFDFPIEIIGDVPTGLHFSIKCRIVPSDQYDINIIDEIKKSYNECKNIRKKNNDTPIEKKGRQKCGRKKLSDLMTPEEYQAHMKESHEKYLNQMRLISQNYRARKKKEKQEQQQQES